MNLLWEILVPTVSNEGKPFRTRFHRVWDKKVRAISGGLTILTPVKGQWIHKKGQANEQLFAERMIPVRIACTQEQIESISHMTSKYYSQKAVMYYRISDMVVLNHYELNTGNKIGQSAL